MHDYKVTMVELQKDGTTRTIIQQAHCRDRQEVIDWYGLEQPDILSYTIVEV